MSGAIVEARGLGKMYGLTRVLTAVDLAVSPGSGLLIIGDNGAGKSTLIRMLAGLAAPSNGHALLFGEPSLGLEPERRRQIGLLTHNSFLYSNLTVVENLEFYAELYGLDNRKALVRRWIDRLGLGAVMHRRARRLSRGMERRVALGRALLAEPAVLLLDEPFAALDLQGVALASALLKEAIERDAAVLMTAHTPLEIEGVRFPFGELASGRFTMMPEPAARARLFALFGH